MASRGVSLLPFARVSGAQDVHYTLHRQAGRFARDLLNQIMVIVGISTPYGREVSLLINTQYVMYCPVFVFILHKPVIINSD